MDKVKQLDSIFSEFVRLRDSAPYGHRMFRCISCGRLLQFEQADAGHFVSRGNMATRWDEQNVWSECIMCNRMRQDHLVGFRRNLEKKIGVEAVEDLIRRGHQSVKFSQSELDEKIAYYKWKIKELKK